MTKRRHSRDHKSGVPAARSNLPRRSALWAGAALLVLAGLGLAGHFYRSAPGHASPRRSAGPLSFHAHVAPIIYRSCAGCHHSGGAAPFALVNYADVQRRAKQIADVTSRRIMPPWLPVPGCAEFVGDRSLAAAELALIQQWVEEGAQEGDPGQAPALPVWRDGWQLGAPDLIVTIPEAFLLEPSGEDTYRNFVVPVPNARQRYVRAVELAPGSTRALHHAFLFIDNTPESRRLDAEDPQPGFASLHVPATAQSPPGHFLSWQPGKLYTTNAAAIAWSLEPNSDLVIQAHLSPTGKPEKIQPSVGFYFAADAAPLQPMKVGLWSYDIDIPAGEAGYLVRDSYTLPADVDVLRILPHAHFLGRTIETTALLPDGQRLCLLRIDHWDFNWQGDYTYLHPIFLPRNTVISTTFSYDNSAANPRNPKHPPQRVKYGRQSTDEMCELWLQLMPRTRQGSAALEESMRPKILHASISYNRYLIGIDPKNAKAHNEIGKSCLLLGGRTDEARQFLRRAIELRSDYDEPHYYLGLLYRTLRQLEPARVEFLTALQLNPHNGKYHGNLGLVLMDLGDLPGAEEAFRAALRIDPNDTIARQSLAEIARPRPPATPRP